MEIIVYSSTDGSEELDTLSFYDNLTIARVCHAMIRMNQHINYIGGTILQEWRFNVVVMLAHVPLPLLLNSQIATQHVIL